MNFNPKLKKIRTFRKMTQKELSEKIGLTDQHRIVQYEKGVDVYKRQVFLLLMKIFVTFFLKTVLCSTASFTLLPVSSLVCSSK